MPHPNAVNKFVVPSALCAVGAALALLAWPVLAADAKADPDWLMMTVELLGGLAIFLYGMLQMEEGLRAVAGERPVVEPRP